jgi:hypothetical protein
MVRAKITKTTNSDGSEKDVEVANGVEVDPFEALKLQEQDHDVSKCGIWTIVVFADLSDQISNFELAKDDTAVVH